MPTKRTVFIDAQSVCHDPLIFLPKRKDSKPNSTMICVFKTQNHASFQLSLPLPF